MSEATMTEGWGFPGKNRKAHYFRESMSLCSKRGLYFGPLKPDTFRSPDDCAACRRALDREEPSSPLPPRPRRRRD